MKAFIGEEVHIPTGPDTSEIYVCIGMVFGKYTVLEHPKAKTKLYGVPAEYWGDQGAWCFGPTLKIAEDGAAQYRSFKEAEKRGGIKRVPRK